MSIYKTLPIDRLALIGAMKECFGIVKYKLGAKPALDATPGDHFKQADCSGFVRWILHEASYGKITIPTGSWYQREWCKSMGFKPTSYPLTACLGDSRLRIAFINPRPGKSGHVWLVINGQTVECYGGHGIGRREWNTPVLLDNVDYCFVLTEVLQ